MASDTIARTAAAAVAHGEEEMARKPNYQFERMERERQKAAKTAAKAAEKREQRERARATNSEDESAPDDGEA